MFILTAHNSVVAVNAASDLVQVVWSKEQQSNLVRIQDAGDDTVFDAGPMRGFRIVHAGNYVRFVKDGCFLCAEPGHPHLIANRKKADGWETFTLVSEEHDPQYIPGLDDSASNQVARFGKQVSKLIADNKPVKLHFGCGTFPREGFLNLDIDVMAPDFAKCRPHEYFIFRYTDMRWGIPDNCVDYIFHEDFIEHLTQLQQIQFLAEAYRVLRPGCYHRVNTPNIIACMRRFSTFKNGYDGVYTGEQQWGHISIFSPASLKEIAELIGYKEVVFTTKNHGVSPFAVSDFRPFADRDEIVGNIYADLQK